MRGVILFFFWRIGWILERLNRQASLLGVGPFLDPRKFPWVFDIEADWRAIRAEVDELLLQRTRIPNLQDISEDTRSLTQDDEWKTYVMVVMGAKVEGNCQRCPKTMDVVKRIPGLRTAIFSILGPGKHIPEHRGYFNGLLRYHLGLMVPGKSGDCRIRVGKEVGHWEEGKSLIFDDTYQHEVWNDSDHDRVVLYIDFLRPMKFPMSLISKAFISIFARPFVKEGKRKITEWEEQYVRLAAPLDASGDRLVAEVGKTLTKACIADIQKSVERVAPLRE